jgi:hypothetical protein
MVEWEVEPQPELMHTVPSAGSAPSIYMYCTPLPKEFLIEYRSVIDSKLFVTDLDPSFQKVIDPDPTFQMFRIWLRIRP